MTHVTCRLTAKNRDQLRNPTLGNRAWLTSTFFSMADRQIDGHGMAYGIYPSVCLSVCLYVCHILCQTRSVVFVLDMTGCVGAGVATVHAGISVAVALLTAVVIGLLVLVAGLAYFRSVTHHHPLAHSRSLLRCIGEQ